MKDLNLPDPIAAYFNADGQDGRAVARCFTRDGQVRDEGRTHAGTAAIEAWRADSSARYAYTTRPFRLEQTDGRYVVTSHVAGNFPGSPVDLRYTFTLQRQKIATLVTPNRGEFREVAGRWKNEEDLTERAQKLRRDLGLEALLVTRSEEGMTLYREAGRFHVPAQAREVYDVSGAGDTVIAVLGVMLAAGAGV